MMYQQGNVVGSNTYDYIILGAGCAGLSICYYLIAQNTNASILLLDQRQTYQNDRTWCFWDVEESPFTHLHTHSWQQWRIIAEGKAAEQSTPTFPYRHLPSSAFYSYVLTQIAECAHVRLALGERINHYQANSDGVDVTTVAGTYRGRYLIDARGLPPHSAPARQAQQSACWIAQQFVGQRIRTTCAVFDPAVCTLMDFSVDQSHGLHFIYILPFSTTEALVENVYMHNASYARTQHLQEIATYLSGQYGLSVDQWHVVYEERGYIPMTDFRFPFRVGERVFQLGMAGGQIRASSGYTFMRIQRVAQQLARALTEPDAKEREKKFACITTAHRRYHLLDSLLLRYMAQFPERCPSLYLRLFSKTSGAVIARFMSEQSTIRDDLAILWAMPIREFAQLALQTIWSQMKLMRFGIGTFGKQRALT